MADDTKEAEYIHAHGSLDTPFPFAYPEPDTPDTWHTCYRGPIDPCAQDDSSPCPLGHLARPGVSLPYTDENLTYRFERAEVEISLSPLDTDNLLLPVELLVQYSRFFKNALSDLWLASGETLLSKARRIRFELLFEGDGGSYLLRKSKPTPWLERLEADNTALLAYTRKPGCGREGNLNSYHSSTDAFHPMPCDQLRRTIVESYKVGFALMLRLPVTLDDLNPRPTHRRGYTRITTALVVKLIEFAEFYSTASKMGNLIEHFVHTAVAKHEIAIYQNVYLRVATVIRSKEIFQEACIFACNDWENVHGPHSRGLDPLLHSVVLASQLRFTRKMDITVHYLYNLGLKAVRSTGSRMHEIAQAAWHSWLSSHGWSDSYPLRAYPSWGWGGMKQDDFRSVVEHILAGRFSSITIVNVFIDAELCDSESQCIDRRPIYETVDIIIMNAIELAKRLLIIDGPGFIKEDYRLNGVDFSPYVFTYPWEQGEDAGSDQALSSRLDFFYNQAVNENNLVAKQGGARREEPDWHKTCESSQHRPR